MPSCWLKSSENLEKKSKRERIIDWHRKCIRGAPQKLRTDIAVKKRSQDGAVSQCKSPPLNRRVSRSQTIGEAAKAQPLPLPVTQFTNTCCANHGNRAPTEASLNKGPKDVLLPLHKPGRVKVGNPAVDCDGGLALASNATDSFSVIDDPSDPCPLNPQTCDCEKGIKSAIASPPGAIQMDKKDPRESLSPLSSNMLSQNQTATVSHKQASINSHVSRSRITHNDVLRSAPDSSVSTHSRRAMRVSGQEPLANTSLWLGKQFAESLNVHCSSPGSGSNSIAGDIPGQVLLPQSRCSPEYSPSPSPRMMSPGPGSSTHSGAVTPLHVRDGRLSTIMPTPLADDRKKHGHQLPLPPLKISNPGPSSPSSARTSPQTQLGSPSGPAPCWKQGRLLGKGTFGQVYIGFNSETGEMCAMKEVTLLSDDVKSKECAKHLGQEIVFLSRLHHPNIVQYYGSASFSDKLYIYLEYVSGGSVHKILQDYGPLGEVAIQSYTQQILSGLSYLHSRNTLHRDIKGANILVDPNGRVKLADFGLAKHIEGQSCPLSLKGSPYWMAPEVIGNSSKCSLAVDIWSLGCTVLEMATTRPPWSEYEGVAAMFKIVKSKELPAIPDHLSSAGKDFVLQCLQRNPCKRPTAAQLLEHPFIKRSASLERFVPIVESVESTHLAKLATRARGLEHADTLLHLDTPRAVNPFRTLKAAHSYACETRNASCRVSELGSPYLSSRSPQNVNGRVSPMLSQKASAGLRSPQNVNGTVSPMLSQQAAFDSHSTHYVNGRVLPMSHPRATSSSPSPQNVTGIVSPMLRPRATSCPQSPQNVNRRVSVMLSPQATSGSRLPHNASGSPQATSGISRPSCSGSGTPSAHYLKQPKNYLPQHAGILAGSRSTITQDGNGSQDHKANVFRGIVQAHLSRETVSAKGDLRGHKVETSAPRGQKEQHYNGHSLSADCVSRQLLLKPLRLDQALEPKPTPKPVNALSQ